MGVTYHFGYPNMQRIVAIDEAVNNAQNGEKYQVNYRGKYRPLTVIEVPIEMLVYRIENIRTKSLQKEWLAQHRDLPRDLFVSDPNSIEAQENQHQVLKKLVDKENLLKTFKDNDKLQQTEPLICSKDGVVAAVFVLGANCITVTNPNMPISKLFVWPYCQIVILKEYMTLKLPCRFILT